MFKLPTLRNLISSSSQVKPSRKLTCLEKIYVSAEHFSVSSIVHPLLYPFLVGNNKNASYHSYPLIYASAEPPAAVLATESTSGGNRRFGLEVGFDVNVIPTLGIS